MKFSATVPLAVFALPYLVAALPSASKRDLSPTEASFEPGPVDPIQTIPTGETNENSAYASASMRKRAVYLGPNGQPLGGTSTNPIDPKLVAGTTRKGSPAPALPDSGTGGPSKGPSQPKPEAIAGSKNKDPAPVPPVANPEPELVANSKTQDPPKTPTPEPELVANANEENKGGKGAAAKTGKQKAKAGKPKREERLYRSLQRRGGGRGEDGGRSADAPIDDVAPKSEGGNGRRRQRDGEDDRGTEDNFTDPFHGFTRRDEDEGFVALGSSALQGRGDAQPDEEADSLDVGAVQMARREDAEPDETAADNFDIPAVPVGLMTRRYKAPELSIRYSPAQFDSEQVSEYGELQGYDEDEDYDEDRGFVFKRRDVEVEYLKGILPGHGKQGGEPEEQQESSPAQSEREQESGRRPERNPQPEPERQSEPQEKPNRADIRPVDSGDQDQDWDRDPSRERGGEKARQRDRSRDRGHERPQEYYYTHGSEHRAHRDHDSNELDGAKGTRGRNGASASSYQYRRGLGPSDPKGRSHRRSSSRPRPPSFDDFANVRPNQRLYRRNSSQLNRRVLGDVDADLYRDRDAYASVAQRRQVSLETAGEDDQTEESQLESRAFGDVEADLYRDRDASASVARKRQLAAEKPDPQDEVGESQFFRRTTTHLHLNRKRGDLSDVDILNFALTLEHLESAFYKHGLEKYSQLAFKKAGYKPWVRGRFEQIAQHERTHVEFLESALGGRAVQECAYDFPDKDIRSWVEMAYVLENISTSGYNGVVSFLRDRSYLTVAASILGVEARHASWITSAVRKSNPWNTAFETPLNMNQVFTLASAYIIPGSCPSSNPSIPATAFPTLHVPPCKAGKRVTLSFDAPSSSNSDKLYAAFIAGTGTVFVEMTNGKEAEVPKGLEGLVYVVVSRDGDSVRDETTVAGPAVVWFSFKSAGSKRDGKKTRR